MDQTGWRGRVVGDYMFDRNIVLLQTNELMDDTMLMLFKDLKSVIRCSFEELAVPYTPHDSIDT
jgi:hypothetical protein